MTADILARIGAHKLVSGASGGKDSSATGLHLRELGLPFQPVFLDTGWEARQTYDYLRGELERVLGPITWLRAEVDLPPEREEMAQELEAMLGHYSAMVRLCLRKMMMPARQVRWCTQAAKVEPLSRWIDSLDTPAISVLGIRHEESAARAKMDEWEWDDRGDRWLWRPIIRWTLDEVIAIHKRHGLTPNPLYLAGATRVGCYPCIFARKSEIRQWADIAPERVAVVRRLEEMIAGLYATTKAGSTKRAARAARAAGWYCPACCAKGEEGEVCEGDGEPLQWEEAVATRAYQPPTWFQHNSERTEATREVGYAWPIDRVVEWSHTSRGGRQVELFAAPERDAGCMRWGLCDLGHDDGDDE